MHWRFFQSFNRLNIDIAAKTNTSSVKIINISINIAVHRGGTGCSTMPWRTKST